MSYLDELTSELERAGVRGATRDRIVTEFADHLAEDPQAELGPAPMLARQFADELGTSRARGAARIAFAALALAGVLFAIALVVSAPGKLSFPHQPAPTPALGLAAAAVALFGAQLAFVAGVLALLRSIWRRRAEVIPRAEATVLVRRAAVGLGAGIAAMGGLVVFVAEHSQYIASWRMTVVIAATATGAAVLAAAAPAVWNATRLMPTTEGTAGDLLDDVGQLLPSRLQLAPAKLALIAATALLVIVAVAGVIQSDPYDGVLRALAESGACLGGFALLGRYLGLRASS